MSVPASISSLLSPRSARRIRRAGFTLLETMIGLSIFIIGGLGVIEVLGLMNQNATVNRANTAARLLVGAKIAKAQTDIYTPSNGVVPLSCIAPSNNIAVKEPADAFDFAGASVPVITSTDSGTIITGVMYHYVSTFESASGTLLVTYQLKYTFRGKTYTVSQSTIRAPDQI